MLLAAGVLGAAVAFGRAYFFGNARLPLDLGQLPESTTGIGVVRLQPEVSKRYQLNSSDLPKEAVYSAIGEAFCSGRERLDVFRGLMEGRGVGPDDLDDLRRTLSCGKTWYKRSFDIHLIKFSAGKEVHEVAIGSTPPSPFPEVEGFKSSKDPEGFKDSLCESDAGEAQRDDKKSCAGRLIARFEKEPAFAVGRFEALDAFGKEFSPTGAHKLENMAEVKALLGNLLSGVGGVAVGKDIARFVSESLPEVDDTDRLEEVEKLAKSANAFAASNEQDGAVERKRLEFAMSSSADAKELSAAFDKFLRSAKARARSDADKGMERLDRERDSHDADDLSRPLRQRKKLSVTWERAKLRMKVRALDAATAEQDEKTVVVMITTDPNDDDKEAWKELRAFNAERAKLVGEVIAEIMEGRTPDKGKLKELGDEAVTYFSPPDYVEVDGLEGQLTISGARCPARQKLLPLVCTNRRRTSRDDAVSKLSQELSAESFAVEKNDGGALIVTKGSKRLKVDIVSDEMKGTTYTVGPAPEPAVVSSAASSGSGSGSGGGCSGGCGGGQCCCTFGMASMCIASGDCTAGGGSCDGGGGTNTSGEPYGREVSGRSSVPTELEFELQFKEVWVAGSTALQCETKKVREWLRIKCFGDNGLRGSAEGVTVLTGDEKGDVFAFMKGDAATLVMPFVPNTSLRARFEFSKGARIFSSLWAIGQSEPARTGWFEFPSD